MTSFRRMLLASASALAVAARIADGNLPPVVTDARRPPDHPVVVMDEPHHA